MRRWLGSIEHFIFDLDGTLILGKNPLPYAIKCLNLIKELGKSFTIITNNSSRSIDNYDKFLTHLGFKLTNDQIHTSGKATAAYISSIKEEPSVYLLGTRALVEDFTNFGIVCVDERDVEPVDFVVLAFDLEITYRRIVDASILIQQGVPFIATHADINIPTELGLLPDCGSFIAMLEKATGVSPKVIGKPNLEMIQPILEGKRLNPEHVLVIGDRMYTDIEMGVNAGCKTMLVYTGESNQATVNKYPIRPTVELPNLEALYMALLEFKSSTGTPIHKISS